MYLVHQEVLKVLLKNKVNVNKQVSASKCRMSPLMMAAERGYLDMVRLLVQSGATVELLGMAATWVITCTLVSTCNTHTHAHH